MARAVTPFLMFEGAAEEAMHFYVRVFRNAEIRYIERYGADEPGAEGSVKRAEFALAAQSIMCIDSPIKHAFTFTPSVSLFVECEEESELNLMFSELADGGSVLMPPSDYGFSKRFTWVSDRYGVSWQLNLQ